MSETANGDVIRLLPESVANQIAAGEVIQRPASVLKELVENSIDAGATRIDIVIKDAGKTLMQVIDNGCGMSDTDARMAFERHATSKIRKADDLFTLHTMGFRGEALPSIAAVAEIDMRTMRANDRLGTRLTIKASEVQSQQPEVCNPGTSIAVKNLFYNFVARRRFLKKDTVEFSHIMHEFERLVLVNPDVEFSLTSNGSLVHHLLGGPLKERIGALFGRTVETQIIPVQTETTLVKISGFVGLPANARRRNALQYLFVNGRHMRHPYFHKAIVSCYETLIPADLQPNYFIYFTVDTDRIDVNVHPQKNEIKFEDESLIWQILQAAVRESLGKFNVGPAIDFDAVDVPDIPPLRQGAVDNDMPAISDDDAYNPFALRPFDEAPRTSLMFDDPHAGFGAPVRRERPSALNNADWEKLYEGFRSDRGPASPGTSPAPESSQPVSLDFDAGDDDASRAMVQVNRRWIVTSTRSGLLIVDQHRAHLRVLYDRILPAVRAGSVASQKLIFPESFEADGAQSGMLVASSDFIASLGFEVERDADNPSLWHLLAAPAELGATHPAQALLDILGTLAETGTDPGDEQRSRIALSLARAAAIPGNVALSDSEMQHLVADLFRSPSPSSTPDGQPTAHILNAEQLAALFHRC